MLAATSCLIWEGFRGCQQPVWQPGGCRGGAPAAVGTSGDSHSSHCCQLPHVSQGTGQSLAAQNSSSESGADARQWHGAPCTRAATEPGWAALGHPAGLPAAEIYSSFPPPAGQSADRAAPGSWKMGVDAALVPSATGMCCCSARARG